MEQVVRVRLEPSEGVLQPTTVRVRERTVQQQDHKRRPLDGVLPARRPIQGLLGLRKRQGTEVLLGRDLLVGQSRRGPIAGVRQDACHMPGGV